MNDANTQLPYLDGAITVDSDFVRISQRSYRVPDITGVRVAENAPHSARWAYGLIAVGLYATITQLWSGHYSESSLIFSLLLLGAGCWQWQRSQLRLYVLTIFTQAHPEVALTLRDRSRVLNVRAAIEQALAERS